MNLSSPKNLTDAQPAVGIDLGTTFSVVAYVDASGRPMSIPNRSGELLTPSAIAFEEDRIVVGREAIRGSSLEPETFADCFKLDMGQATFRRKVADQSIPPEVLSAFLLARLKEDAEARIGLFKKVVITVPAFFDEGRRKATQDAGKLAGLEVLDIINEPTAAAVAFGYHKISQNGPSSATDSKPERLLVYDLGGGTFDVTILEIEGKTFRTLATDGDVHLGGRNFDERLFNHLAELFEDQYDLDPRSDTRDAAQLWINAREVKHALTEHGKTTYLLSFGGQRLDVEITREKFEELTADLLSRTEMTTNLVVREAELNWSDIDRVLMVGGSTRMPMVEKMLHRVTNLELDRSQSVDEAVAFGAALYAQMLLHEDSASPVQSDMKLINVNSHSLGVVGLHPKTRRRVNVTLIPKNTPLPATMVKRFQTGKEDQRTVKVAVIEGENPMPEHCISLGQCVVRDLPSGLPKGTRIEVEYQYGSNGRLSISARVPSARSSAHVQIERNHLKKLRDLPSWLNLIAGKEEEAPSDHEEKDLPMVADRVNVRARLDELYVKIGEGLLKTDLVPIEIKKTFQTALKTVHECRQIQQHFDDIELTNQLGGGTGSRRAADLARTKLDLQNGKTKARFTLLILGREAYDYEVVPHELADFVKEIRALRKKVEAGS